MFLNSGPMFHIGNFQFYGIPVLIQGGTNVVTRRVIASEVLDILAERKSAPGRTSCRPPSPSWSS